MSDTIWKSTPPTELGWYWLLRTSDGDRTIARKSGPSYWLLLNGDWFEEWVARNYEFGPRVPSAEELAKGGE